MAKKSVDYSTPDGVKAWLQAAAFSSDKEAALALGTPFRTFCRYKSAGLPTTTAAAMRASQSLAEQMQKILAERSKK